MKVRKLHPAIFFVLIIVAMVSSCAKSGIQELSLDEYLSVKLTIARLADSTDYDENVYRLYQFKPLFLFDARTRTMRLAREACRKEGIRYREFNRASAVYGYYGFTYNQLVDFYVTMHRDCWMCIDGFFCYGAYDLYSDLGLSTSIAGGEENQFIDLDKQGITRDIAGNVIDVGEVVERGALVYDPYILVFLHLDSLAPAGRLFETISQMPSVHRLKVTDQRISRSEYDLFLKAYPMFTSEDLDTIVRSDDLTALILVDSAGQVRFNGLPLPPGTEIVPLVKARSLKSISKTVVIASHSVVSCGAVLQLVRKAYDGGANKVMVVPLGILPKSLPSHLNDRSLSDLEVFKLAREIKMILKWHTPGSRTGHKNDERVRLTWYQRIVIRQKVQDVQTLFFVWQLLTL